MANIKFSQFTQENDAANVDFVVGYVAASNTNVRIAPSQLGVGVYLPLTGGTMTGDTLHADSVSSYYGAGNDLRIYHTGSTSYIQDVGTGSLIIDSSDLIMRVNGSENAIIANSNGAVDIYYNNVKKLATTNAGVSVTGDGYFSGRISSNTTETTGIITIESNTQAIDIFRNGSNALFDAIRFRNGDNTATNASIGYNANQLRLNGTISTVITTGGTSALTIDSSQNSTFAGIITLPDNKEITIRFCT